MKLGREILRPAQSVECRDRGIVVPDLVLTAHQLQRDGRHRLRDSLGPDCVSQGFVDVAQLIAGEAGNQERPKVVHVPRQNRQGQRVSACPVARRPGDFRQCDVQKDLAGRRVLQPRPNVGLSLVDQPVGVQENQIERDGVVGDAGLAHRGSCQ